MSFTPHESPPLVAPPPHRGPWWAVLSAVFTVGVFALAVGLWLAVFYWIIPHAKG